MLQFLCTMLKYRQIVRDHAGNGKTLDTTNDVHAWMVVFPRWVGFISLTYMHTKIFGIAIYNQNKITLMLVKRALHCWFRRDRQLNVIIFQFNSSVFVGNETNMPSLSNGATKQKKIILCHKYFSQLHQTNAIVFTMYSIIKWTRLHDSVTIIDWYS